MNIEQLSEHKYNLLNKCTNEHPLFSFENTQKLCKIVNVYDGDTFTACFYYNDNIIKCKCRTNGYDSPEMRPRLNNPNRDLEKEKAKEARQKFIDFSNCEHDLVNIKFGKFDKYGRILAEVYNLETNENVNKMMIKQNFGYEYNGGKKKEFS